MRMDFKIDARKLTSITKGELARQARFASAKTLTQAAYDSRSKIQRYLRLWLKLKRTFIPNSLIVTKATTRHMTATLGFLDRVKLIGLVEEGGTRRPKGRAIAIPTDNARTGSGNLPKSRRPKQLLSKKNNFSATINGTSGIWTRDKRTNRVKLLYLYERRTSYDKTTKFRKSVERLAPRFIRRNLMKNLEHAIDTRKR